MVAGAPRLYTIAPDRPFLRALAEAVLRGFPCADPKPPGPLDLGRWTILLPTRRAVREMEEIFFELKGSSAVLLPRIRPIGEDNRGDTVYKVVVAPDSNDPRLLWNMTAVVTFGQ